MTNKIALKISLCKIITVHFLNHFYILYLTTCFCFHVALKLLNLMGMKLESRSINKKGIRLWKHKIGIKRNPLRKIRRFWKSKNHSIRNLFKYIKKVIICGKILSFRITNKVLATYRESKPRNGKDFHRSFPIQFFSMEKYNHKMLSKDLWEIATSCQLYQR